MQIEIGRLMHHDEQELHSVCGKDVILMTKSGWLDPELCAQARREEVEYIRRHKMHTRVPREACLHETGKAPIKTGWAETDTGATREAQRAREVGREGVQAACEARVTRVNAVTRGAESCVVGDRHWHAWRKGCGAGGCEKRVLLRSTTEKCVRRTTA